MISINKALFYGHQALKKFSPTPRLDAEVLLSHVLNKNRAFLYAYGEESITETQWTTFQDFLTQRKKGMPIAYLIGRQEFWSLPLLISKDTLIPRPETECLVSLTLSLLETQSKALILELGTGSGAIALALASERPDWNILATDISPQALAIAKRNAETLNLTQVTFQISDWFKEVPQQSFHAIVTNPPYIATNSPHLLRGDIRFEPYNALESGPQGLDAITHIITSSKNYLASQGLLLLEHGYQQGAAIRALLAQHKFKNIKTWTDIQGHERVSGGMSQINEMD